MRKRVIKMAFNQQLRSEAIKRFSIRFKVLTGQIKLKYPLHSGHHARDVWTILAILNDAPNKGKLIKNLCGENDIEKGE